MDIIAGSFVWDAEKETQNLSKHGVDFATAALVFRDPGLRIYIDSKHSASETRLFAFGRIRGKVLVVRFTYRGDKIRIFGAGYWRKGRQYYEKKSST